MFRESRMRFLIAWPGQGVEHSGLRAVHSGLVAQTGGCRARERPSDGSDRRRCRVRRGPYCSTRRRSAAGLDAIPDRARSALGAGRGCQPVPVSFRLLPAASRGRAHAASRAPADGCAAGESSTCFREGARPRPRGTQHGGRAKNQPAGYAETCRRLEAGLHHAPRHRGRASGMADSRHAAHGRPARAVARRSVRWTEVRPA